MNLSYDIERLLVIHDVDARARRRRAFHRREARSGVQPPRRP